MHFDPIGIALHLIIMGISVMTFWKAGEMEDRAGQGPSLLWASLSALIFLAMWLVFACGWPALIGGQIALLLGIGVVRAFFTPNHEEK
jgi:tryptophan-rich sensory protein